MKFFILLISMFTLLPVLAEEANDSPKPASCREAISISSNTGPSGFHSIIGEKAPVITVTKSSLQNKYLEENRQLRTTFEQRSTKVLNLRAKVSRTTQTNWHPLRSFNGNSYPWSLLQTGAVQEALLVSLNTHRPDLDQKSLQSAISMRNQAVSTFNNMLNSHQQYSQLVEDKMDHCSIVRFNAALIDTFLSSVENQPELLNKIGLNGLNINLAKKMQNSNFTFESFYFKSIGHAKAYLKVLKNKHREYFGLNFVRRTFLNSIHMTQAETHYKLEIVRDAIIESYNSTEQLSDEIADIYQQVDSTLNDPLQLPSGKALVKLAARYLKIEIKAARGQREELSSLTKDYNKILSLFGFSSHILNPNIRLAAKLLNITGRKLVFGGTLAIAILYTAYLQGTVNLFYLPSVVDTVLYNMTQKQVSESPFGMFHQQRAEYLYRVYEVRYRDGKPDVSPSHPRYQEIVLDLKRMEQLRRNWLEAFPKTLLHQVPTGDDGLY